MRKEIKKLIAATMSLAMLVGAGNVTTSSARGKSLGQSLFSFDIRHNYQNSSSGNTRKRETKDMENAWGVQLNTSKEAKDNRSVTIFCLKVKTSDGKYRMGSDKHKVHARWGMRYYTAYDNTGGKNVTLFGQDNVDKTTDKYHVTGYWSPQTGKDPEHDMD